MPLDRSLQIQPAVDREIGSLTLSGQLMAESRFDLEQILRTWTEGGVHFIAIHCRDLKFIDSAGLSTLIGGLHRLRQLGGELVLCEMNPALGSLFEATTLNTYFQFFPTARQAEEHLRRQAAERKRKGAPDPAEVRPAGKPKPRTKAVKKPGDKSAGRG